VLQFPMNLFETGPAFERKEEGLTVLEAARAAGIGVLVNRPLNAMAGQGMVRLADPPPIEEPVPFDRAVAEVERIEEEFRARFAPHLRVPEDSLPPDRFFRWAEEIRDMIPHLQGLSHWRQIQGGGIVPAVTATLASLDRALIGESEAAWKEWRGGYVPALETLLRAAAARAAGRSRDEAAAVSAAIDPALPAERRGEPLSRKALWTLASTPGVSCVLTGIRSTAYVDDALAVLAWPPLADPLRVLEAAGAARGG